MSPVVGAQEIPFKLEFPVEVWEKSGETGKERRIGGIISTEHRDKQGEIVLQRGLDFADFLRNGWLNDNHSKETTGVLGYPETVRRTTHNGKPATYMEGYLLPDYDRADEVWRLAQSLQKTKRQLGFSIEGKVKQRTGSTGKTIAQAHVSNVAVTNCFPGDVRVCGAAEDITKRFYSGPMVEIHLSTGEKLTGTSNHPIFTQRGWVGLSELNEVHDRVGRFRRDTIHSPSSGISHDIQNVPSTLEEIFDLCRLASATSWISSPREGQFHGDWFDGDVDVVPVYGHLRNGFNSSFIQKFGKDALIASDKQLESGLGQSLSAHFVVAGFHAPSRFIGCHGEHASFGEGPIAVAPNLFFVPIPDDTMPLRDVVDSHSSDTVSLRDGGRTLSRSIGFGNIISKRTFDFRGHVFNLQARHGWYEANGIVAHNCPVLTQTGLELLGKSMMALEQHSLDKAMAAGQAVSAPAVATPGDGFALRTESLEGSPADTAGRARKKKKKKGKLSKAQALDLIRERHPGVTPRAAERIWQFARK